MTKSLRTKLIMLFLLVGLIPIVLIGLLSYNLASQNIEDEVFSALDMYAGLIDAQVEDYFLERVSDGRVISTTRDVYESMNIYYGQTEDVVVEGEDGEEIIVQAGESWEDRREYLDDLLPLFAEEYGFEQVFIQNTSGLVIYDTLNIMDGENLSGRDYFQGAMQGTRTWSELYYSDVIHNECIILANPIYSRGVAGDIVGVLNILVTDEQIDRFLHEGLHELGETADSYLVDASGLLHSNTMLGEFREDATLQESINTQAVEMLAGPIRDGNFDFYDRGIYPDYLGNDVLSQVEVTLLGDTPIGLVVEIDYDEAFAGMYALRNYMLIIGLVSAVVVAFVGAFIGNSIARPVKGIADNLSVLATQGGDLTQKLEVRGRDEIAQLASAFNSFLENLSGIVGGAMEIATGVNSGSESVSSASEEMSSSLEEVSASTNEFSSNAQNLSENSQAMAEANSKILEQAGEGNKAIEEAVNQMQVISNRVSELQEVITEVDQRSSDIGKILGVITDIADQTNLLALNAAIEAARAGEQGRGFAVVAEEVRKLAEQSAGAAKEIGDLITSTQDESKKALESMTEGVKDVESGTEVVSKTGVTFGEILNAVQGISKQVEETASAAQELSAGSEEMAASIEEQSSTMEEMAATAEELRASAEKLTQELGKFKYE